ncbi:MAG: hypothetical protein Q9167_007306 [Letrouitia subvulpina]
MFRDIFPNCCEHEVGNLTVDGALSERDAPMLPTRVLEVGIDQYDQDRPSVRLHVTSQPERAHYIALSHRWGLQSSQEMPMRTTLDNLTQRCEKIEFDRLPLTFRDAITITRALEVRYLWIDALCIVQDDQKDWLEQSSQMGFIFRNSFITLAIHSAKNSSEGFLWRSQVPRFLSVQPHQTEKGGRNEFYTSTSMLSDSAILRNFKDSELSHRAWVLQELCLSPRILHVVEDRFIWECVHRPVAIGEESVDTPASILRRSPSNHTQQWLKLIERYSSCKMTKSDDKLPAIAGISNIWATLGGTDHVEPYYYGIFESNIINSLLWMRRDEPVNRKARRVPTWSWASVDGEIQLYQEAI